MDGRWRFWAENGELETESFYTDDHGDVTNYGPDGSIQTRGSMDKLVRVGLWTELYPSGRKRMQGNFVAGKQHGLWHHWTDEDNPRQASVTFEHGEQLP